ncbi:MAG: site-2 protease family protein, partial [Candidatus Bipolaricaulota bacterium]
QKEVTVTPKYYAEEGRYMLGVSLGPAGNTRIAHVREDSVFRQAGLRPGDRVLQVGDRTVSSWAEFLSLFREDDKSSPLELTVERGEQESQLELPRTVVRSEVLESLSPEIIRRSIGPVTSIRLGLDQIRTILIVTYQGLRMVIAGDVPAREAVSGPVGIANYLGQGLEQGIYSLFTMIALISLNLGIINLIPFPALDGSRIGFALYEGLRGRPIPPEREGFIHTIGFVILLALLIFLTYQDILRLIS